MKRDYACKICDGLLVRIRGRHPSLPNRVVCPNCLQERLDRIADIALTRAAPSPPGGIYRRWNEKSRERILPAIGAPATAYPTRRLP